MYGILVPLNSPHGRLFLDLLRQLALAVQLVQLVLQGHDPPRGQVRDLALSVRFPVVDVGRPQGAQGAAAPDQAADPGVVGGVDDPVGAYGLAVLAIRGTIEESHLVLFRCVSWGPSCGSSSSLPTVSWPTRDTWTRLRP